MRSGNRRRVTAIFVTAALAAAGVDGSVDLAVRAAVRAALVKHPALSVAAVSADAFAGRITLLGVSFRDSGLAIKAERLCLPSPPVQLIGTARAEGPAPAAGGVASAEGVSIVSGSVTYRIKRIDMTGTSLSSADLMALLDPKSSQPVEARLKALTAGAIAMPEILMDDATPGSERHATFSSVALSGVAAGKVASGSVGAIAFTAKTGDEDVGGKTGAVRAAAINLPQIAHVIGASRRDDSEPLRPLYASLTATDLEIKNRTKSSSITIGALKETGVQARPLKNAVLAESGTKDANAAALDELAHTFAIDSLEATDIAMRGAASDGGTADIASLTTQAVSNGRIESVKARTFAFASPKVKLGFASFDLGPIVLPRPKAAAVGANATMPMSAAADLRGLDVEINPDEGGAGPTRFTVGHSGFTSDGDPDDIPKSARVTVDNLGFDLPSQAGKAQPLAEMGYHHLDLSGVLATRYDGGTHAFEVQPLSVNGTSMGTIGLGLRLVNVTKGIISQNQEIAKAAAFSMLAKGLSLDLVNDGLIDRAIAWKAKQDGLDVDKERSFLVDFFADKLPSSLGDSANLKIIGTAIAKFVTQPKTLHISIASQSGLGMGSLALLADPGLLIDTLEVKATANE